MTDYLSDLLDTDETSSDELDQYADDLAELI